jgi:hypothetical protein
VLDATFLNLVAFDEHRGADSTLHVSESELSHQL